MTKCLPSSASIVWTDVPRGLSAPQSRSDVGGEWVRVEHQLVAVEHTIVVTVRIIRIRTRHLLNPNP